MSKTKRSAWMIVGAVLALLVLTLPKLGVLKSNGTNGSVANAPRDQRLAVRMLMVRPEKLGDRIVTVGTILSNEEVEIRSEVSGKVEKIYFSEGGRVHKGEVLLKINDAELQAQLSRAQYRQAIAAQEAERKHQLFEKKLASQEEYDIAVNQLNIVKAEAQLIEAQIGKTEIHAPFAGVIGLRYVSEGSYISPATRITTLQDFNPVKVDFTVPEKYARSIKKGDKITFTVEGATRSFDGNVYAVEAKIDPTSRTLHVRALSPNPEGALIPGAFANVELVLEEKETLLIPAEALIPELKGHSVFLYKGGQAVSQAVGIGTRTEERVEVTQGLTAGDTLITSAILQLRPGMAIRPITNDLPN